MFLHKMLMVACPVGLTCHQETAKHILVSAHDGVVLYNFIYC